ncbi:MAG: PTS sugar transporter subunit IIA, partial [Candidatus Omnitrophica bacterium]|nr:PTS sugar transporter subunit IIA [Candidatus Omnitrophota bacterium]
ELKDIVMQRDEIIEDKFHKLIEKCEVLDIEGARKMEDFFKTISETLGKELNLKPQDLCKRFIEREADSTTAIRQGLAIPHIIIKGEHIFKILLVRAKTGVIFTGDQVAHIVFVIIGSADERGLHLKALAAIAQITENPEFDKKWLGANNIEELRHIILLSERRRG